MPTLVEKITTTFPDTQIQSDFDGAPKFETPLNEIPANWETFCTTKGILTITGEQRLKFLQGQATCDTSKITTDKASYGAFCNLKGRAIANFLAYDDGTSSHLIMHQGLIPSLIDHLTKFAVFFRVTLSNDDSIFITGQTTDTASDAPQLCIETQESQTSLQISPTRTLLIRPLESLTKESIEYPLASEALWNLKDHEEGITWVTPATSEVFLPQLLGLEEIDGLSFSKGCYTGQEIIARMKYRGQLKRHLQLALLCDSEGAPVDVHPGSKLNTEDKGNIGQIINLEAHPQGLLALLALEDEFTSINNCSVGKKALKINLMEIRRH